MPRPSSEPNSNLDWLDLNLPVPDAPLPHLPNLPIETVFALNDEFVEETTYDDAYFARSLAHKNPEPFVM